MRRPLMFAMGVVLVAVAAMGQPAPPEEPPSGADEPLAISLSVDSEEGVITGAVAFNVTVHNQTDVKYTVVGLAVRPPRALTAVRGMPDEVQCLKVQGTPLESHQTLTCRVDLAPLDVAGWRTRLNPAALTFVPRDYPVHVTVRYEDFVKGKAQQTATHVQPVRFEPGLSAFVAGGVIGALLLGLFIAVYEWRDVWIEQRYGAFHPKRLGEMLIEMVSISAGGAIVAVIAILLLQRVSDLSLPITVKVEDYLGGIVFGLFSGKIGETLYRQMRAGKKRREGEEEEAATETDEGKEVG